MEAQSIKEDLNLELFNIPFTWTLQNCVSAAACESW